MEQLLGSQIERARRRLWMLTFSVLTALTVVLIVVSTADVAGMPEITLLPSRRVLAFGLAGALLTFALYIVGAERKLRTLSDRLIAQQLEMTRLAAEQAEQRDFVSMAAHELRAPLTAIKGFTKTLMTRFDELRPERRTEYLALVGEQSNRLSRLIDDLMEVARIDAGAVRLNPASVDVTGLTLGVVDQFRSHWGARVHVNAETAMPAWVDAHKTEAILINLIDNALKYSPADAPVTVTIEAADGSVEVSVEDSGPGLSEEEASGLFSKFHRLPQAVAEDIPGTGLGLYIVRGLVEAQGGTAKVESEPGRGSTFSFRVPATSEDVDPVDAQAS